MPPIAAWKEQRYQDNMKRVRVNTDSQHWLNSPAYGPERLREVEGQIHGFLRRMSDDPALAACEICDLLPTLYGLLHMANRWQHTVQTADPGAIPDHGARGNL